MASGTGTHRPTAQVGHRWQLLATGVSARLRALCPIDAGTVWVAGAGGTVLRTVDAGQHWQRVDPPGVEDLQFRALVAVDAEQAVLLSFGAGPSARILRTEDGGAHWRETFRNDDPDRFFDCLVFGDRDTGLALADPVRGRFALLASTDAGRTWAELVPRWLPAALPGETAFAASGTCLVGRGRHYWFGTGGGGHARVFRTADAGTHWSVADTSVRAVPDAGIFALAFRDPAHGVAVGGDYHDQSRPGQSLADTEDGGHSWRTVTGTSLLAYRSSVTWTGQAYLAVGPSGSDLSVDGRTWTPLDSTGFDTVRTARDGSCWAAGQDGSVARLVLGH